MYRWKNKEETNNLKRSASSPLGKKVEKWKKKKLIEKKEFERKTNRLKVLDSLLNAYSRPNRELQGKFISELEKETGLTRMTVYNILYEKGGLVKDGFVRKIGNKRGRYYLTSKAFNDHTFRAHLFERATLKNFLGQTDLIDPKYIFNAKKIVTGSKFCNTTLTEEIEKKNHERISADYTIGLIPTLHIDEDEDALLLFEFANRVGFLMTYTFVQALNPEQVDAAMTTTAADGSTPITINNGNRALLRDTLSTRLVDNAINVRNLFEAFISIWFKQRPKFRNETDLLSIPEVGQNDFNHLAAAFASAYPLGYYEEMDRIRKDIGKVASDIAENSRRSAKERNKTKKNPSLR